MNEQSDLPIVNDDYLQKYQNTSDFVSDLKGGAIAAVTDFGASVWNSLPFTENVETGDLLRRIDPEALRVYEENPDTIHTASFLGGLFVPSGLALKGMNLARQGVKGVSWFSEAGKVQQLNKLDETFRAGAEGLAEYRAARTAFYGRGLANQVTDAAAMELAILGTMNAHPYMEDYMKDVPSHFVSSLALGGAIGGAVGHIADRFSVAQIVGRAASEQYGKITSELKTFEEGVPAVNRLQIQQSNINSLKEMLASKDALDPVGKEYAAKLLNSETANQIREFDKMVSNLVEGQKPAVKEALMKRFIGDERFLGFDAVTYYKETAETAKKSKAYTPAEDPTLISYTTKTGTQKIKDVGYIPEFDAFVTTKELSEISRAHSVPGVTEKSIEAGKDLGKNYGLVPNMDSSFELMGAASAKVDEIYLKALARVDKMDAAQISKLAVAPDDLPLLNALVSRIQKTPDEFQGIKIKLTRNEPNYGAIEQATFKTGGVSPDHLDKIKAAGEGGNFIKFSFLESPNVSPAVKDMISGWLSGYGMGKMQAAFQQYFRPSQYHTVSTSASIDKAIYESPQSEAFRNYLKSIADPEGNVYLYRGLKTAPRGSNAVESFTTTPTKANKHGTAKLFKVHADDVIGLMKDIPDSDGVRRTEILVGSPARQIQVQLPVAQLSGAQISSTITKGVQEVDGLQLVSHFLDQKDQMIKSMLDQGFSAEGTAIRTNTPIDTVRAIQSAGHSLPLDELAEGGHYLTSYNDASKIGEYLAVENRPLILSTNVAKVPYAKLSANLDTRALSNATHDIIEAFMRENQSPTMQSIADLFYSPQKRKILDILRAQVNNAVNEWAGNRFVQSYDFFSRNMKELGPIAGYLGKQVQEIGNAMIKRTLEPATAHMQQVAKDPAALVEFNTAYNLNASLKGVRRYHDRQFWQEVKDGSGKVIETPALYEGREFYIRSDSVDSLLQQLDQLGREMYGLKNSYNKIIGKKNVSDLGFWLPAFNPLNKHLAYVMDSTNNTTRLLWGNTADELKQAKLLFEKANADKVNRGVLRVITKDEQEDYNLIHNRLDTVHMEIANVERFHGGSSATAVVRANTDLLAEIAQGYEHYIHQNVKQLAEVSMFDTMDMLERMSLVNQSLTKDQPLGLIKKLTTGPKDAALTLRNTLLGNSNLKEYQNWRLINQGFELTTTLALNKLGSILKDTLLPFKKVTGFGSKRAAEFDLTKLSYEELDKKLQAAGIVNPYEVFDQAAAQMFNLAKLTEFKNTTPRIIYASNNLAATMALRVMDLAQPLVNAMSLPILMLSGIAGKQPETFLGVKAASNKFNAAQIMHEGIRASHSPQFQALGKRWEEAGYFTPMVSEVNNILKLSREFDNGPIAGLEKALDSKVVELASKPADLAEGLTRRLAMFTGAMLGKRLYPELDEAGLTIFSSHFLDRVIGNYNAAQRPVMFQGTFGVAMGLFQTYMVTFAQNMYRHLELKNYKALAKTMLAQQTIFGAASLPGFNPISDAIATNFSDDNTDLRTGTYRALADPLANIVLYGLPSSIGPAFYSRGELAPRIPTPTGGVDQIAAVNMISQLGQSIGKVVGALGNDSPDIARAMGEALSMQSLSRPLARGSELLTGYSVTRQGNTIAAPEEVWTPIGVFSRMLATRPLEEAKLRETIHSYTLYESLDREKRQEVTAELKTAIRNGTLTDEKLSRLAEEYMRTGTPTGWRAAINNALATSNVSGKYALVKKLSPENPLNHMIDSLDE